jgi:hypothetical protein
MTIIPENFLKLISPANRKALGKAGQTAEEAMAAYSARSEKELQKQICNLLRLRGIIFLNPAMSKKSPLPIGWPDFTIFLDGGKVLFLECKFEGGKLTDEQFIYATRLANRGYAHHVVRTLREVQDLLQPNP